MSVLHFESSVADVYQPKKRALLIGIVYENAEGDAFLKLKGPHKDVYQLKELLIDRYGYKDEDIMVLMDDGQHEAPTRENILRGMARLVEGAKADDCLLFHYSGHGDQISGNSEEEDNNDEAIIPCDADFNDPSTWIVDDLMNDYLVKPLPAKCRLTAIFDSCHSGTALDLDHYCNRFYVPWIPRGRRRTSLFRNRLLRRNAMLTAVPTFDNATSPVHQGHVSISRRTSPTRVIKETVSIDVEPGNTQKPRRLSLTSRTATLKLDCSCANVVTASSTSSAQSKVSEADSRIPSPASPSSSILSSPLMRRILNNIDSYPWQSFRLPESPDDDIASSILSPLSLSPMSTLSIKSDTEEECICSSCRAPERATLKSLGKLKISTDVFSVSRTSPSDSANPTSWSPFGLTRCLSPIPLYGCPGSRMSSPIREKAQVFSISACNDGQQAYEDPKGLSMTAALVEFLKNDPHPTFANLMKSISHRMWNAAMSMNQHYQRLKKKNKAAALKSIKNPNLESEIVDLKDTIESGTIQEPLLGSTKKLNMDEEVFTF